MKLGSEGLRQQEALAYVLNFKTMGSAKKPLGCFFIPKSFTAFITLDDGCRGVNMFLTQHVILGRQTVPHGYLVQGITAPALSEGSYCWSLSRFHHICDPILFLLLLLMGSLHRTLFQFPLERIWVASQSKWIFRSCWADLPLWATVSLWNSCLRFGPTFDLGQQGHVE